MGSEASSSWCWTEELSPRVAFAVWVLQQDGLAVPPFADHAGGDGALRGAGLDPSSWQSWLTEIVGAESRLLQLGSDLGRSIADASEAGRLGDAIRQLEADADPVHLWHGDGRVRTQLATLWARYQPLHESWRNGLTSGKRHERLSAGQERRLWRGLEPLRRLGRPFVVFSVLYPRPVALAVPPSACVAGIAPDDRDGKAFVDAVIAAAGTLAGAA